MFGMFKKEHGSTSHSAGRQPRHSRGWIEVRTYLQKSESLRVLDFGSTSPVNINYLTTLGHSVYMANIVEDATRPEWLKPANLVDSKDTVQEFDTDRFIAANLDFSSRDFDVILLWDTANFLPPEVVPALFARLRKVLRGPETAFSRFQLGDGDDLRALDSGKFPVRQVYQNRQVEKFLEGYSSFRFFLGKDNVREVIAVR
jgi:hypothetical protein